MTAHYGNYRHFEGLNVVRFVPEIEEALATGTAAKLYSKYSWLQKYVEGDNGTVTDNNSRPASVGAAVSSGSGLGALVQRDESISPEEIAEDNAAAEDWRQQSHDEKPF